MTDVDQKCTVYTEWMLGHLPLLGKRPGLTITKWHQELGPIFRIKVGSQNWVFVGDVEAAHELLVSKGSATAGRPEMTYLTKVHSPGERQVTDASSRV